ncbi:YitT family protein [Anaerocolumna xylanovorans]|uniref:Uncharacterized 5xTM membrane BCR, YitT family COG1284 n=1 Tax=Anaerocolumna xylanovorans DSM 12503 TaxID=1121345 RepID=A0A1M7YKQ2_9FIRM|nr:YitT family protein [Anaerocolumna xylanovorans]SHO53205.1 Uncharacterised 5xTM membrane BCR, YitT family COG1284 [Anaerocolumna xylanovorans DSM 12503]
MNWRKYRDILIGNLLITFCYACITVPNHIINGGVTSFSMVSAKLLDVPTVYLVNVVTLLLLGLCYIGLGKEYFFGTIFSCICYLALFNVFSKLGFTVHLPKLLSVLLSAAGVGAGYYMCLQAKATTVGFDVLALILNKKWSKLNIAYTMGVINLAVMLYGGFIFGVTAVIYGAVFVGVQSFTLNELQKYARKRSGAIANT